MLKHLCEINTGYERTGQQKLFSDIQNIKQGISMIDSQLSTVKELQLNSKSLKYGKRKWLSKIPKIFSLLNFNFMNMYRE